MMTEGISALESAVLGVVQGLTEFLPVSSSGHLQIAKQILGVTVTENLAFDVTLHLATVLSTLTVLRREVADLIRGTFSRTGAPQRRYVGKILLSMIPVGVVGLLLKDRIDAMLAGDTVLAVVGAMMLLTALLLLLASRRPDTGLSEPTWAHAAVIGLAQAAAAMPGLSRSGTTISTSLLLGDSRQAASRFSFLMVLIPILGESLLDLADGGAALGGIGAGAMAAGFAAAYLTGTAACRLMLGIVRKGSLKWFSLYCAVVGAAALAFHIL